MTRSEVFENLEKHSDAIKRFGVTRLGLFGSASRNEALETIDLDFLVELEAATFDNYMDLKILHGRPVRLQNRSRLEGHDQTAIA